MKQSLLVFVVLGITACAHIQMESQTDPDHEKINPESIIVYYPSESFEVEKNVENEFEERLNGYGYDVIRGTQVFPRTRDRSSETVMEKFLNSGHEVLLIGRFNEGKSHESGCVFNKWELLVSGEDSIYTAWVANTCSSGTSITAEMAVPVILKKMADKVVKSLFRSDVLESRSRMRW